MLSVLPDPSAELGSFSTRLILVRHAQSTWNEEGRMQGQLDPPLSDLGCRQAERLAANMADRRPARLYSSDLSRAILTAAAMGRRWGVEPEPEAGLRELHLGEWQGLNRAEVEGRHPEIWAAWQRAPDWDLVPGGEGGAAFTARVSRAVDAIWERHPGDEVVVVTHGGVINVILASVIGIPRSSFSPFLLRNASISMVESRDGRRMVSAVNNVCHLAGEPA